MLGSVLFLTLIFALLGVRLGWSLRLLLLVPLAVAAVAVSCALHSSLWQIILSTLILNVAAQGGFCVGALTSAATRAPAVLKVETDRRI